MGGIKILFANRADEYMGKRNTLLDQYTPENQYLVWTAQIEEFQWYACFATFE